MHTTIGRKSVCPGPKTTNDGPVRRDLVSVRFMAEVVDLAVNLAPNPAMQQSASQRDFARCFAAADHER
jgi:hypothetical protein